MFNNDDERSIQVNENVKPTNFKEWLHMEKEKRSKSVLGHYSRNTTAKNSNSDIPNVLDERTNHSGSNRSKFVMHRPVTKDAGQILSADQSF